MIFATETAEEAIASVRLMVAKDVISYLAFAHDGFITDEGAGVPRTAAVIVEAYERGRMNGVRFAQRYLVGANDEQVRRLGNLRYGGAMPRPTEAEYGPLVERFERERQVAKEVANDED